MNDTVFAIMTKQPQVGRTKTRLCPTLSSQEAVRLYEALLLDTIALTTELQWADLALAITPPGSRQYFETIAPSGTLLLPVEGKDIGDCLAQVMEALFKTGYHKALALNSDGPSLPLEHLKQAAFLLEDTDIVLGPGHDGGYYLVGMNRPYTAIFGGIAWSTERVFMQTVERITELGLHVAFTPQWYDVDTPGDLLRLRTELERLPQDRLVHTRRFLAGFDPEGRMD